VQAAGRRLVLSLAALLCLAVLAAPAEAQRKVHVYKAKSRPAGELVDLATTALDGRGQAAVDPGTNSLVLIGDPEAVAEAIAVLDGLDRALRNVVLRYQSRREEELRALGVDVRWSAGGGGFRIGNVHAPGGGSFVSVVPIGGKRDRTSQLEGTLRVIEGNPGQIYTGTAIPIVVDGPYYGDARVETLNAESGFEARPRILGDGRVQVEIQPFEGSLRGDGSIRYTGAATTVVVKPGETVALGGISQSVQQRSRGTTGAVRESGSSDQVLLLTVEVEGGAEPQPSTPAAPRP
jgi:type II secretory pathway component GspD/PulD (secretin)